MGAQTRTDVLPYISLIPVFGYLWPGTSTVPACPRDLEPYPKSDERCVLEAPNSVTI